MPVTGLIFNFSEPGTWNWGLLSLLLLSFSLLLFFIRINKTHLAARDIALIATLASVAALGRIPFAAIPSVQPTTFLVMAAGLVFGPRAGFLVGCLGAFVSNCVLGQGPWTPWQMLAWGLVGLTAGWLGRVRPRTGRYGLAFFGLLWGYLFGWIMDLSYWLLFVYPLTWAGFLTACAASIWFDTLHAASNVVLALLWGPEIVQILKDYRIELIEADKKGG